MSPSELVVLAQAAGAGPGPDFIVIQNWAVGWGTLSLINAGLAQAKGRGGLPWFVLSILLGPVATFLIVVLKRVPAEVKA